MILRPLLFWLKRMNSSLGIFDICGSYDPAAHYKIALELGLEKTENSSGFSSSVTFESPSWAFWCVHRVIKNIAALPSSRSLHSPEYRFIDVMYMFPGDYWKNERNTRKRTFQWNQLSLRSFPHISYNTTICSHMATSNYKGVWNHSLLPDALLPQIR